MQRYRPYFWSQHVYELLAASIVTVPEATELLRLELLYRRAGL